jgi:hypothetical protein
VIRGARTGRIALALSVALAGSAEAQSVGTGVDYLGYDFEAGLNADAAQLFLVPLAVRIPVNQNLRFDLFSAWADGRVEQNNNTLKLTGPVDTSIKGSWQATPWAMVSIGVNVPTGNSAHDSEEAIVASVLSNDLLGFREATWGTGLALTSSVAAARKVGGWGLGIAAAYAARSGFEPTSPDDPTAPALDLTYQPGNEVRIRGGLDRNFGNSTLTLGATFINYAEDKISDDLGDNRNLFQAGSRIRFDATYAFRAGAGVWTIYGADLIRQNGDLRVALVDEANVPVGEDILLTAKQNLIVAGVMGTVGLGDGFVFRPHVDFKNQAREEADGNTAGSGWIFAAGGDIPLRIFGGYEFFPKARVYWGAIEDPTGANVGLLGLEVKGTLRLNF